CALECPLVLAMLGARHRYVNRLADHVRQLAPVYRVAHGASQREESHSTRIRSERVMMKVLSVLKSRTRTAGLCGVIIVESRSTGVEMSTNGNAGSIIDSTGWPLIPELRTSSWYRCVSFS